MASVKESLDPIAVDDPVLKDAMGRPVIPGSSVKGVVRSYFEAVLRGAGLGDKGACDVLDNENYCTKRNESRWKDIRDKREQALEIYECSCMACRLFGGHDLAGKLMFKDCSVIGPYSYENRDGVAIDRDTGAAKDKAKYDFEIVSKDTVFSFCLIANNLDSEQEKQLKFIISAMESGNLAVGGKTSRGLGRFRLEDVNTVKKTAEELIEELGLQKSEV